MREITRVIEEQINSVRRELMNLESIGIIRNETFDNKSILCGEYETSICTRVSGDFWEEAAGFASATGMYDGSRRIPGMNIFVQCRNICGRWFYLTGCRGRMGLTFDCGDDRTKETDAVGGGLRRNRGNRWIT